MKKKAAGADNGPEKTNAARLLDRAGIPYQLVPYDVDPDDLSAVHVAATLGEEPERVFKTLVLTGDRGGNSARSVKGAIAHFVCVIPAAEEVDLKKAAKAAGMKKAEMLPMKELLPLTGYIRGGCTPVGMKKQFPTFFHTSALSFEKIFISAGQRGLQLELSPKDIIDFTGAQVADLIKGDASEIIN